MAAKVGGKTDTPRPWWASAGRREGRAVLASRTGGADPPDLELLRPRYRALAAAAPTPAPTSEGLPGRGLSKRADVSGSTAAKGRVPLLCADETECPKVCEDFAATCAPATPQLRRPLSAPPAPPAPR